MEMQFVEALGRIEERLSELSQNVERRLSSLERKIDQANLPPRSIDRGEARRLLGVGKTKLQEMINDGRLQTCDWSKEHIPMSEIVRLTSVRAPMAVAAPQLRGRRSTPAYDAKAEAEALRAELRAERKRR